MKSKLNATIHQGMIGEGSSVAVPGYIFIHRWANTNALYFQYSDGVTSRDTNFSNFFLSLDDQYIHIVLVCDYTNKTLKAYRNGVQFDVTKTLTGTPVFPTVSRVKYIGAYASTI